MWTEGSLAFPSTMEGVRPQGACSVSVVRSVVAQAQDTELT